MGRMFVMMLQNRIQVILFLFLIQIPMGQAQYYFGRNKIQYNQFEWQVLRTEHFDIYYYPEMEQLFAFAGQIQS